MPLSDTLGLLALLAAASAVLATLFVKSKNKAVAENWQQVATSATARADEATRRAAATDAENAQLRLRVEHLEQQVKVLADTVTAKGSIDALAREIDQRFDNLTALVVEVMTTAGIPRVPASSRRATP